MWRGHASHGGRFPTAGVLHEVRLLAVTVVVVVVRGLLQELWEKGQGAALGDSRILAARVFKRKFLVGQVAWKGKAAVSPLRICLALVLRCLCAWAFVFWFLFLGLMEGFASCWVAALVTFIFKIWILPSRWPGR